MFRDRNLLLLASGQFATSLFAPARDALVPQLVVGGEGDRVGANALVKVSDQFAWLLGPMVSRHSSVSAPRCLEQALDRTP